MSIELGLKGIIIFIIAFIAIQIVEITSNAFRFFHKYFWIKVQDINELYGENSWVIIVGSKNGYGRDFALQFAEKKFNLILIGSEDLSSVSEYVEKMYNIETLVIQKDFNRACEDNFINDIQKEIHSRDCSILIMAIEYYSGWIPYHSQPISNIMNTISRYTIVQSKLSHLIIPILLNRKRKTSVIFITSQCTHRNTGFATTLSNEIIVPYTSILNGCLSFSYYHACSLIKEYGDHIDFLNITPGGVLTEKTKSLLKEVPFTIDSNLFVKNIIKFMGNVTGTTCAYWGHAFSSVWISLFPWTKDNILRKIGTNIALQFMQNSDNTKIEN